MVNSVLYRDFRLSVLTPGLFRIEKSKEKAFHGNKTQLVDFRDFDAVPFTSEEKNGELILRTEKAELHFTGSIPTSYFLSHRKKIFLNNDQNLGGTYSNLDGMDGAVRLYGLADSYPGVGVCSRNGVALLDDSRSYCLNEKEEVTVRNPDEKDVYVFFFPEDYEEAVRTFFRLSGVSPLLPRYVFGNWWSRFYNYTQESYLYQMEQFKEENVPFTVATVDMNWHPSNTNGRNFFQDVGRDVSEFYHKDKSGREVSYCQGFGKPTDWIIGWTGYSFNKPLFPDYQRFLKDLHALGLHVTLNIHPANGIAFFEDQYGKCCEDLGLDPKKKESIPFNVLDPKLLKDYEDNILHPYEKDGVDFWWYDWQQGNQSALPGLNMLWAINHYLYWDRARQTDRPVILSRYCGLGGQRYPIGFSGDTFQSFATLRYLVKTTSMASNIGFPYWSHDIGGHQQGHKDGDLYLKFVQFAVFSPILRLHCSSEEMLSKNPDLFLGGYGELVKRYLRLRQSLIPYLDSENYHINAEGETLLRPLYYSYPKDEKAYSYAEKEYFFGKDLLVAPFFTPEDKDGFTSEKIYLPEGEYVDPVYGYSYAGKKELKVIGNAGRWLSS
jgi:alpha-glucosidase (family GH31 glycosyl hydrolase)